MNRTVRLAVIAALGAMATTPAFAEPQYPHGSSGDYLRYPSGPSVVESNGKHDDKPGKPDKHGKGSWFDNTTTINNSPKQSNEQSQGQQQDQKQRQTQDQNQSQSNRNTGTNKQGQSVNNGQTVAPAQSVNIEGDDIPRQAPPAYAPALTSAPETCMGSASGGVSTPFGGISLGSTYKSEDCELRMFARTLANLGQPAAALVLLAQNNAKVAAALKAVGVQLPGVAAESKSMPTVATVASEEVTSVRTSELAQP